MAVVRRVYLYLVSGISLGMFLVGLGNGGGALLEALAAGSLAQTFRETLALSAALILVGLPVWLLHWRKALELAASDAEERASALRRLYFYAVTTFLLVAMLVLGTNLIGATLGSAVGFAGRVDVAAMFRNGWHLLIVTAFWLYHTRMDLRERATVGETDGRSTLRRLYVYAVAAASFATVAWLGTELIAQPLRPVLAGGPAVDAAKLVSTAWSLLMALVFWAYHLHIAAENRHWYGEAGASATIRRWYTYAVQFFALATLLFGIREMVTSVIVRIANIAPQSDSALPTIIATSLVACAAWLGHARWSSRGPIGDDDRHSTLRSFSGFGIVLVAMLVALFNASRALYLILTAALQVQMPQWAATRSLPEGLIDTLSYVVIFGLAWLLVRLWLTRDARDAEGSRQSGVRRLYTHLVSFVAVLVLASGLAGLLWTLLDRAVGGAAGPRPDAWLDQASLCATLVVVGLPAWLSHWRPAPTADDRQALSRRLYLFGSLLVAVLTLLASAASVLQRALSEVMGAGAGVPTLSFTQSIAMGLVSAAVLAYHWRILAADNVGRGTDESAEQAPTQEAGGPRLVIEITGANERDIRRALALLPYGASYSMGTVPSTPEGTDQ